MDKASSKQRSHVLTVPFDSIKALIDGAFAQCVQIRVIAYFPNGIDEVHVQVRVHQFCWKFRSIDIFATR